MIKFDGFVNLLTGMGLKSKDKGRNTRANWEILNEIDAEYLYAGSSMAAKIVDELPEEACREWIEVKGLDTSTLKDINDELDRLKVKEKMQEAWSMARLYGGSALFIGTDAADYSEPLDLNRVTRLKFLTPLSKWELTPSRIQGHIASTEFQQPEMYRLSVTGGGKESIAINNQEIHHTRLIRFDGAYLPKRLYITNNYWHDSVLSRLLEPIRGYENAHSSSVASLIDFDTPVLKIANLAEMFAAGQEGVVNSRMESLDLCKSVIRTMIIDKEEEFDHVGRQLNGVEGLVNKAEDRLVAATNYPRTKLLGDSPKGLQSSGKSEQSQWYDFVAGQQEKHLRVAIDRFFSVLLRSKMGPTRGQYPKSFTWDFRSLWQMSDEQKSEIYKRTAEADAVYLDRGVIDANDIQKNRFKPDGFAVDMALDTEEPDDADLSLDAQDFKSDILEQENGEWVLYSSDRSKVLGRFKTKAEALKREAQIQYFANRSDGKVKDLIAHALELGVTLDTRLDLIELQKYVNEKTDARGVPEGVDTVPPKQVQENAKRALRLREEHDSDAMTSIGIARARDLSNGSALSRETISRMSQFARHLKNYDPDKPSDRGTIAVLGWGGPEGIEWAQRKLKEIDSKSE